MCYNAASLTQASLKYAQHRGESPEEIAQIEEKLEKERQLLIPFFHVNAFAHPKLLVFTNKDPKEPQFFQWGLIPSWAKDEKTAMEMANQTLNARSESMFEKASFRNPAKNKRCLIYLDAFYEFHHLKGKTYPFHIEMADHSPMVLAGLWEEWLNQSTGELICTVTVVTSEGNHIMSRIHNNPKATGPRMPVILTKENQHEWLKPILSDRDKDDIMALTHPIPDDLITCYAVGKLLGKDAVGNRPEAFEPVAYKELQGLI